MYRLGPECAKWRLSGCGADTVIVTESITDRDLAPHTASLFDTGQKYADLLERDRLIGQSGDQR